MAQRNGLILCGRVGKHTDSLAQELAVSTEGKTDCKEWNTDVGKDMGEYYQMKSTTMLAKA